MDKLTDKQFWEERNTEQHLRIQSGYAFYGESVLKRFLTADHNKSILEIGCYPGRNLLYFAAQFDYQTYGVDYTSATTEIEEWLNRAGVTGQKIYQEDIFTFAPGRLFDVVFSDGFIEHFSDCAEMFKLHAQLTTPGGFTVVGLPNMRYGQYLLRRLLAPESLTWHNLEMMNRQTLTEAARAAGLEVHYCDYVTTFDFWVPRHYSRWLRFPIRAIVKGIRFVLRALGLGNLPNRFFSPHLLVVARKP